METKLTPSQYFQGLKESMHTLTPGHIKDSIQVILSLSDKYQKTGQTRSLERLKFLAEVLRKEEKLLPLGVTTFIYREDIEDYIEEVADNAVKIIELRNYLREIPDEIVEVIEKTKDIFSEFYVVFTDYTGREERRIAKERRDKDPILFGCFKDDHTVGDRFYFLGDWIDPYCDLTLDKLIEEYKEKLHENPARRIEVPETTEELVEVLGRYEVKKEDRFILGGSNSNVVPKRKSFFERVRSIFSGR